MKRFIKTLEPLSGLPNGFKEVEYLESSGTQYIDTGVMGNGEFNIKYGLYVNALGSSSDIFAGARSSSQHLNFGQAASNGQFTIGYLNQYWQELQNFATNTHYDIEINYKSGEQYIIINGTKGSNKTYTGTEQTNLTIYLFKRHHYGTDNVGGLQGRIYYFTIKQNDTLVRDYIPCLDPSGRPCMYDKVEGKPYYNLGTGEFTYGKQIIPVDYLESTGTQYIDTGIKLNNNSSVELDYQLTQAVQNRKGLFGGLDTGGSKRFGALLSPSNNYLEGGYGSGNEFYQLGLPDTNRHVIKQEKNLLYFDGSLIYTFNTATFTQSFTAPLGNFTFTNYNPASAKYYSSKWWDGDTLVRDYIPVIDENNVGYMLDKLSHTLYENKGTGSFNYGTKLYKPKLRLVEEKAGLSGLPNGFTEVEYLQSTGTQYIDLGVGVKSNTVFKAIFSIASTATGRSYFGARNASNERFQIVNSIGIGGGYYLVNTVYPLANQKYEIEMHANGDMYLDGVKRNATTGTFSQVEFGRNLWLFATNYYDSSVGPGASTFWKVQISEGDTLVRDYIPALDAFGVPCMYDKVEGKAYYNQGTGEFTYGKQIIPVEYLESTGTQYIDTGYAFTDNFSWEIDFDGISDGTTLFGGRTSSTRTALLYQRNYGGIDLTTCPIAGFNGQETPFQLTDLRLGRHTIKMSVASNKGSVWVDGTKVYNKQAFTGAYISGTTQALFADKFGNNDYREQTSSKVYGLKMWQGSNIIRDFIPAIDENDVGYMFDKVTHSLYENNGTGAFNYGTKVYKRRLRLASEPWYIKKYDLLTYLESTGTQYIDTGCILSSDCKGEALAEYTGAPTKGSSYIFGTYGGSKNFGINADLVGTPKGFYGVWYNQGVITSSLITPQQNVKYKVEVSSNGIYINDTLFSNVSGTFTGSNPAYLFWANGTGQPKSIMKLYWTKFWDGNGVLVRDFRPAKRKSDNKYGMLDMVTKQFYTNAGTGDFTGE